MTPTTASNPTPQERETRIAELRARRHARLRTLAMRSAIGVGVLAIIAAFALYWLLMTVGGREFLLGQIAVRLPADATFTWKSAQGPVSGPMTLHGVHFDYHGTVFDAKRVTLDPDIRPLFGKLLRLDSLDIEGARLSIPKSDKPFELPRWPDVLPKIDLPLGLQADTIHVNGLKVTQAGAPLIDVHSLRGGLDARQGKLKIEHLVIDSDRGHFVADGTYDPREDFATDLTVSALLPAPAGSTRPRLGLAVRGDLARMDVAVSGNAPGPLRLRLALRGKDNPRWTLRADSKALDPTLLATGEPGTPLAFQLVADGVGGEAKLHGKLARGDLVAVLQPSRMRVQDQVLELKPLVVDVFGGRVTARGRGDFNVPDNATFKFAVQARDLTFGGATAANTQDAAPAIGVNANFGLAGTTKAWAAIGKATLTRDNQRARLDFDGRGDPDKLALKTLHVAMPTGTLDAGGMVGWTPGLHWDIDARLAGFDPGYFASGWPGAINGRFTTTGNTRNDGGLDLQVDANQLGGRLRGRKLDGRAKFAMHGAATGQSRTDYDGDIALTLGNSRIDAKGKVTDTLDVDAKLSPLQLADLLPGAAGTLRGTLALSGRRNAPDLAADLTGSGLKYANYTAADLSIKGHLPWKGANGSLAITASDLNAGVALQSLRVDARGAVENMRIDAAARGEIGALDLAGDVARRGSRWQGTLATLHLSPAKGADWRLQSPARFAQTGIGWTLSKSCFASSGGGILCADADWPRRGLAIHANALPLTLAEPYLPGFDQATQDNNGRVWSLHGDIALDAQVRPSGDAFAGSIKMTSASGGLRARKKARHDILAYDNLVLDARFDAHTIRATLASAFNGGGRIDAKVQTGWDSYAPLSGDVAINTSDLTWLELFSPDIVDPAGTLDGRIRLGGTRAEPSLGGQARLSAFTAELPALGIVLQKGNMQLDARGDGTASIAGSVDSGKGTLHVDGTLGWRGDNAPLQLKVRGDNVLVSDTRDLHAVASPDLTVRYTAGQPLEVTGKVTVPSALIDLERLDQGVSASDDVVVLDPVDPEAGPGTPLALDLSLVMGDDVRLKGFGLDGTLGGKMRVNAVPGRPMTAQGALEVGGIYKAYGQKLAITRGHLQWSNTEVDDPRLDIRAEREIESEGVTAGIDVTGRASSPQANVWTDPATSQSDALSYLALGRATSSLSGKEGQQLNAAAMALNAGGNLLASQLGSKIGLDSAGIMDSRALGGSVLGIGKKLSPRLYVGFGVSLLGTGQVLTLKYLLSKGFDLEIESSTLESRGSINWRKEK